MTVTLKQERKLLVIKTLFDGNEILNERVEHVCIAYISVDSVLK